MKVFVREYYSRAVAAAAAAAPRASSDSEDSSDDVSRTSDRPKRDFAASAKAKASAQPYAEASAEN